MLAKKIALGFGIALVFPLLIHFGVSSFVHEPKWKDYHKNDYQDLSAMPQAERSAAIEERNKKQKENQDAFDKAKSSFDQILFWVALPIGLIAIVVGAFLAAQGIGTGLVFGGIFTLIDGYGNNWNDIDDRLKFLSLLVTFIILIFVGYKKIENKAKKDAAPQNPPNIS